MTPVYKLLLFLIIFSLILMLGYSSFRFINRKINESETGWQILTWSLLLVLSCTVLLFGGLFALIHSYAFLADVE